MLATGTQPEVWEEIRHLVEERHPWAYWGAPGEAGRLVGALETIPFPSAGAAQPIAYTERVERALDAIGAGRVRKVVVARREEFPPADVAGTLEALQRCFRQCWVFAVSDGHETFLGATPELLVRVRERTLETCALAGTGPPGDASLLTSSKDLDEHRVVVDAIRHALDAVCERVVVADQPELFDLPHVSHLRTRITGTLRSGASARDAVDVLHPTPAVCGEPRAAALAVIEELEPFQRGLYAGVVGCDDEYVVAIRSALLTDACTYVYAGAGIVAASSPRAEDEETRAKLRAVTEALRFR